jgi:hypothetical protein
MPSLREILDGFSKTLDPAVDWMELVRDLEARISIQPPEFDFSMRWADKRDLLILDAMQGYVKEIEFLERSLDQGDRCLLLERSGKICAFAWVTFRDYRLSMWHTMHLPLGFAYLVYIQRILRFFPYPPKLTEIEEWPFWASGNAQAVRECLLWLHLC